MCWELCILVDYRVLNWEAMGLGGVDALRTRYFRTVLNWEAMGLGGVDVLRSKVCQRCA